MPAPQPLPPRPPHYKVDIYVYSTTFNSSGRGKHEVAIARYYFLIYNVTMTITRDLAREFLVKSVVQIWSGRTFIYQYLPSPPPFKTVELQNLQQP